MKSFANVVVVTLLLLASETGCVRPSGRNPSPAPQNVASATRKAYYDHRQRMADFYEQSANQPPKTVTAWAEGSLQASEQSQQQLRSDLARFMQPAIGEGEGDELNPVAARKLFSEMAKGLRK